MSGEFALVAYTVLTQAAIGLFAMLFLGQKLVGMNENNKKQYKLGLLTVVVMTVAGIILSLLHLGSPLRAANTIMHFTTSWLSREIIFTSLFFVCAAGTFFFFIKGKKLDTLYIAGVVAGILCVFSQGAIYANTIIPAWGSGHSYVTFFSSVLVLGAILGAVFIIGGEKGLEQENGKKYLFIALAVAFVGIIMQAGYYSIFAGSMAEQGAAGLASMALLSEKAMILVVRWVVAVVALALVAMVAVKKAKANPVTFLYGAVALAVVGEAIGRFVFYGIGVPIGL